jgi:hypothetical protein
MPAMDFILKSIKRGTSIPKICIAVCRINIRKWINKFLIKEIILNRMKDLINLNNKTKLNMKVKMNFQIFSSPIMIWGSPADLQ